MAIRNTPIVNVAGKTGVVVLDKNDVGLGNVDNTSDANKPLSSASTTALNLKYNASNPNGYETPAQLNTRDTNNRNRANHTGTQALSTLSQSGATSGQHASWNGSAWVPVTPATGVTDHTLLTNIGTNTHAQIDSHISSTANPHAVTKTQVGLANVPNVDATARANHTGTQLASTISDFAATVRSTVLTGISFVTSTAVVAADSILVAIGKLQAQSTISTAAIATKEPIITAGASSQYWRGDKTWQTLNISSLTDVDTVTDSPQTGETLLWNGTNWVNRRTNVALISGNYYDSTLQSFASAFTTGAYSTTNIRSLFFVLPEATTFDQIGIECTTASAGTTVRVGIYTSTNGAPDVLLYQSAAISSATTGFKSETIVGNLVLPAGVYWFAQQQSSNTPQFRAITSAGVSGILGYTSGTDTSATAYVFKANTYASGFPNPFGAATDTTGNPPRVMLRKN